MVSKVKDPRALLPDRPSKGQYAEKYEWTERHREDCECVYCVLMQTLSEKYERQQRIRARRNF